MNASKPHEHKETLLDDILAHVKKVKISVDDIIHMPTIEGNTYDIACNIKIKDKIIPAVIDIFQLIDKLRYKRIEEKPNNQSRKYIVAALHISKNIKSHLLDNKVSFIEGSGDCYIENEQVLIYTSGGRSSRDLIVKYRDYNKKDLIVLLWFYQNYSDTAIELTSRDLSEKIDISNGAAHNSLIFLKEHGVITKVERGLYLINKNPQDLRQIYIENGGDITLI